MVTQQSGTGAMRTGVLFTIKQEMRMRNKQNPRDAQSSKTGKVENDTDKMGDK